ncbi:MAG TPA: phosphoribosylanthranilate isomerase [Gemmatimonadaceae bacterium]|jgi:phosphoribosylanthranilate isomerase|nr:phosphoribosylanthranilate isomerase [Gemmatimonadaceae bacterium]HPV74890.1 phosphoribosylanthranilate isomerase [Gemmatimonadaceae bacterium]
MHLKICCIATPAEAARAIGAGASALGLVSAMPSGPGVIDEATIASIAAVVSPPIETYLLTSEREATAIAAQHARCRTTTLQLVDRLASHDEYQRLRALVEGVTLVQVIHVLDESSIDEAVELAPFVDRLLLDSGNPRLAVKELGGTGRTHDWALSARIRAATDRPLLLAGGLRVDNVGEAITTVRPFGIDVCSGVRTDGALDSDKLARFAHAVFAAA